MQCWQMHDGNNIKFTEQLFYSITTNVPACELSEIPSSVFASDAAGQRNLNMPAFLYNIYSRHFKIFCYKKE